MSGNYTGRGNDGGPASEIVPLSAAVSSTPATLITGTSAAGQTTAHTCDANAFDAPYIRIDNVGAVGVTVYANIGSTATTGNRQFTIDPGGYAVAFNYEVPMSRSGVIGFWASATAGIYFTGNVSRFYTASS